MENIRQEAEKLYSKKFKGLNIEDNEDLIPTLMIEFARQMCELQKQDCANSLVTDKLKTVYVSGTPLLAPDFDCAKRSILDTPNVCEL